MASFIFGRKRVSLYKLDGGLLTERDIIMEDGYVVPDRNTEF